MENYNTKYITENITSKDYYNLPQLSNSTLTAMKMEIEGKEYNVGNSFLYGSLVDAILTEPLRVDRFRKTLDGYDVKDIWNGANNCAKAIREHKSYIFIIHAQKQKISISDLEIKYKNVNFTIPARCKWDFFGPICGDIKTTSAKSQKEFDEQCEYLDYYRARAFYMDIENTNLDLLIGVSKVNYKVFTKVIKKGDDNYLKGKEQYSFLCFKYWMLKM